MRFRAIQDLANVPLPLSPCEGPSPLSPTKEVPNCVDGFIPLPVPLRMDVGVDRDDLTDGEAESQVAFDYVDMPTVTVQPPLSRAYGKGAVSSEPTEKPADAQMELYGGAFPT